MGEVAQALLGLGDWLAAGLAPPVKFELRTGASAGRILNPLLAALWGAAAAPACHSVLLMAFAIHSDAQGS